jgi:hypothetical protein
MEPSREGFKTNKPRPEEKPKRFRLIKLEDRIAPGGAENFGTQYCSFTCNLTHPPGHCK